MWNYKSLLENSISKLEGVHEGPELGVGSWNRTLRSLPFGWRDDSVGEVLAVQV